MRPTKKSRPGQASRPPVAIVISYFWNCEKLCDCMSWGSCRGEVRGGGRSEKSSPSPSPIRYYSLFTCPAPPCQALQMVTLVSGRHRASALRHWGWKNVGVHRVTFSYSTKTRNVTHWFPRKFPSIMFSQETLLKTFLSKDHQKSDISKRYFLCLRRWPSWPVCCHVSLIISIPPTSPGPCLVTVIVVIIWNSNYTNETPAQPASILRNPVSSIIFKSGLDLGRRNLTGADTKILFVKHQMKINCLIRWNACIKGTNKKLSQSG